MRDHPTSISGTAVPAGRIDNLVMTEAGDEVLVYDTSQHHIHHLNHTSAVVWRLCDGRRTVADLVRSARPELHENATEDMVRLALTKLEEANLLDGPLAGELRVATQSRRTFLRRTAVAGSIAVPAIVSLTSPALAQASGIPCGESCEGTPDQCNSRCGVCGGPGTGTGAVSCCNAGGQHGFPCL